MLEAKCYGRAMMDLYWSEFAERYIFCTVQWEKYFGAGVIDVTSDESEWLDISVQFPLPLTLSVPKLSQVFLRSPDGTPVEVAGKNIN